VEEIDSDSFLSTFHLPPFFIMDHFSPSYFVLLGPLDQAKLAEQVISEPYVRIQSGSMRIELLSLKDLIL